MSEIRTIRNSTNKPLSILWQGSRVELAAFEELTASIGIAARFREIHPNSVELMELEDLFSPTEQTSAPTTMWVANATGNPDAPEVLETQYFDKASEEWRPKTTKNPFKHAMRAEFVMKGAEEIFLDDDKEFSSRIHPQVYVDIPPYKVTEVPYSVGSWILKRARNSSIAGHQKVIKSRPMPEFKPTTQWAIEDIRTYLSLCKAVDFNEHDKYGFTTARLETMFKLKPEELARKIHETKLNLLKRVFFCQIDPKVQLPSREDFDKAKADPRAKGVKADDSAAEKAFSA